jgi:hypothetical protein
LLENWYTGSNMGPLGPWPPKSRNSADTIYFTKHFAWLPVKTNSGRIVWLANYYKKCVEREWMSGLTVFYISQLTEDECIIEKLSGAIDNL